MIDRRCPLCREYRDCLGACPGAVIDGGNLDAVGGALACWTPLPAGGPEIDPLTGDLLDTYSTGPGFPGLVGLLSPGPDLLPLTGGGQRTVDSGQLTAPRAARELSTVNCQLSTVLDVGSARGSGEPRPAAVTCACTTGAAPLGGPRPAGCSAGEHDKNLRCRFESSGSAGVKSATSRVADSRGSPMTQPSPMRLRDWAALGVSIICICCVASAATEGAPRKEPAAQQGRMGGRLGVSALSIENAGNTTAGLNCLLAAIRQVESKGDDNAVGDGGDSIGPYQIQLPYWTDGGGDAGRYRLDAWFADRCTPIILGYWRRYCPRALAGGDLQTLARTHNGGPKWHATPKRRAATAEYWRKVRAAMAAGAEEPGTRNREPGNAEAAR